MYLLTLIAILILYFPTIYNVAHLLPTGPTTSDQHLTLLSCNGHCQTALLNPHLNINNMFGLHSGSKNSNVWIGLYLDYI